MLEQQPQRKHNNGRRYSSATKKQARQLRQEGLTHREISKKLGIAIATACCWTLDIKLSLDQKAAIEQRRLSSVHHWSLKEKRKISLRLRPYQFKQKHTRASLIKEITNFAQQQRRIPLKKEFNSRRAFRATFGTWNNAIRAAGYDPNPVLYSKRIIAADGHTCDSFAEQIIDNWLHSHHIQHLLHYRYLNTKMTADFYVANLDTYVEYFGLCGVNPKYDRNMKNKLNFINKHRPKLIALYPNDLTKTNLTQKLQVLI